LAIIAEHVSIKSCDRFFSGDFGQPFEHARRDAAALQRVLDEERNLGAIRILLIPVVTSHTDNPSPKLPDKCKCVFVVDNGELSGSIFAELGKRAEISKVNAARRKAFVKFHQLIQVAGLDWAQVQTRSVSQQNVRFITRGIVSHRWQVLSGTCEPED